MAKPPQPSFHSLDRRRLPLAVGLFVFQLPGNTSGREGLVFGCWYRLPSQRGHSADVGAGRL